MELSIYQIVKKPIVTEKGVTKKEEEGTLCFEVATAANKTQIKQAIEALFKIKVGEVRTSTTAGKLRRRGKFAGYRSDWKKAYVRLAPGQRAPEYTDI
jgi:large subunit ribosomal protein L23